MMRLLKCIICIAIVYMLSPENGLSERETLDGVAKVAIAAQSTLPEARKAAAIVMNDSAGQASVLKSLIASLWPAAPARPPAPTP